MNWKPVLVTTAHRGVFFGYHDSDLEIGETIYLKDARNCFYWSAAMKGFIGLASIGPDSDCKIGPKANLTLKNITAVVEVSDEACKNWENGVWK